MSYKTHHSVYFGGQAEFFSTDLTSSGRLVHNGSLAHLANANHSSSQSRRHRMTRGAMRNRGSERSDERYGMGRVPSRELDG